MNFILAIFSFDVVHLAKRTNHSAKAGNDVINILTSEVVKKYASAVPDKVSHEFYDWCIFQ